MAAKHDEDATRTKRSRGNEPPAVSDGIRSVAPTEEEQEAYLAEKEKVDEEVGGYEKKMQDEQFEKLRASGQLPPVINPDSKMPHVVSKEFGQIAPPNQNPSGRCTVCGDPLAVGQNFVCAKHVRAG